MSHKVSSTVYDNFAILEIEVTEPLTPQEIVSLNRPKFKRSLGVILEGNLNALATAFLVSMYRQNEWLAVRDNSIPEIRYMVVKGNRTGTQPGDLFLLIHDDESKTHIVWSLEDEE